MEKEEELVLKFLEQLEIVGLKIEEQLSKKEEKKKEEEYLRALLSSLITSKIEFALEYHILTEEEKIRLYSTLLKKIPRETVDEAIQETINLYYLYESGLLDTEDIVPQVEVTMNSLNTLINELSQAVEDIEEKDEEYELLSQKIDQIVSLGTILEEKELEPIENIDFLGEIIEQSDLTDEEKRKLLTYLIRHNIHAYEKGLKKKKQVPQEETKEEIEEVESSLPEDVLSEIDRLLADEQVQKRIVQVMGEEDSELEDQEEVMKLAKEDIIEKIETFAMTPREALAQFIDENDIVKMNKLNLLHAIFDECEESDFREDQLDEIIKKAREYYDKNKNLVLEITREQKESISQYMFSVYQSIENREIIYRNKAYTSEKNVEREATYELEILLGFIEVLGNNKEELSLKGKVCKRMEDVLRCIELIKNMPKEEPEPTETKEVRGNIFFLMKNEGKSFVEEDLRTESQSKGIPSVFYSEIMHQLDAIKSRSTTTLVATMPLNPALKAIKKQGMKYTTGTRTRVFFIPVGRKDAIITGIGYINGKETHLVDQDTRAKNYEQEIRKLKGKLVIKESYQEELEKSKVVQSRLEDILNPTEKEPTKEEILEEMLKEVMPEEVPMKKVETK